MARAALGRSLAGGGFFVRSRRPSEIHAADAVDQAVVSLLDESRAGYPGARRTRAHMVAGDRADGSSLGPSDAAPRAPRPDAGARCAACGSECRNEGHRPRRDGLMTRNPRELLPNRGTKWRRLSMCRLSVSSSKPRSRRSRGTRRACGPPGIPRRGTQVLRRQPFVVRHAGLARAVSRRATRDLGRLTAPCECGDRSAEREQEPREQCTRRGCGWVPLPLRREAPSRAREPSSLVLVLRIGFGAFARSSAALLRPRPSWLRLGLFWAAAATF